jgi:hypothetical protein
MAAAIPFFIALTEQFCGTRMFVSKMEKAPEIYNSNVKN